MTLTSNARITAYLKVEYKGQGRHQMPKLHHICQRVKVNDPDIKCQDHSISVKESVTVNDPDIKCQDHSISVKEREKVNDLDIKCENHSISVMEGLMVKVSSENRHTHTVPHLLSLSLVLDIKCKKHSISVMEKVKGQWPQWILSHLHCLPFPELPARPWHQMQESQLICNKQG